MLKTLLCIPFKQRFLTLYILLPLLLFGLHLAFYMATCPGLIKAHFNYLRYVTEAKFPASEYIRMTLIADPQIEGHQRVLREGWYGHANNVFNDYYFRNVFLNVLRLQRPSFIVFLGDMFSSQYLDHEEFEARYQRYRMITAGSTANLIVLMGNHDVGYGDEIFPWRRMRFEKYFGEQNALVNAGKEHTLVIWDDLAIDGCTTKEYTTESSNHLYKLLKQRTQLLSNATVPELPKKLILLTHIPMFKPAGVCKDAPVIKHTSSNTVYQQNVLTRTSTNLAVNALKPVAIFNGHDHNGCDYDHVVELSPEDEFLSANAKEPNAKFVIPEHTVRTIMGDHSGYTGTLDFYPVAERIVKKKDDAGNFVDVKTYDYAYNYFTCSFYHSTFVVVYIIATLVLLSWILLVTFIRCGIHVITSPFKSSKPKAE